MNLVIDYGNTLIKIAFFYEDHLFDMRAFKILSGVQLMEVIADIEKQYPGFGKLNCAIISSVVKNIQPLVEPLQQKRKIFELNSALPVPIVICYKTPLTLGNDRIASAVGATSMFPRNDLLVIDAGTCITYDFINRNNEFIGGGISPGIAMRFKALHAFTGNLPLLEGNWEADLIGDSTANSILSGVVNGVYAEFEGIVERYREKFPNLITLFTGGDMNYFEKYTKSDIFAVSNLVLTGLNKILNLT
jgi:type III pantothenate kinase